MAGLLDILKGDRLLVGNVLLTLGAFLTYLVIRWLINRGVRNLPTASSEMRRRWLVASRNFTLLTLIFVVAVVWAAELRTFAISIVAVAAAVVIATKELIACFVGGIYRSAGSLYEVGDRIEVEGVRGDVIDVTLLATTVLEIGPGQLTHQRTGRSIVIPNALLLTKTVINETHTDRFVLHTFQVSVAADAWRKRRDKLLEVANTECAPYLDEARSHFENHARRHAIEPPMVAPRVTINVPSPTEVTLVVRVPARASQKGVVEQAILVAALDAVGA